MVIKAQWPPWIEGAAATLTDGTAYSESDGGLPLVEPGEAMPSMPSSEATNVQVSFIAMLQAAEVSQGVRECGR